LNVLAIDQGTSATKALLVGPGDEVLGRAEIPVTVRSTGEGGAETDPEELLASVLAAGLEAVAGARADAVALANQGETVLAWDRATGRPLSTAISWQDRRSAGICDRLAPSASRLARITGLRLDPYFAAPKMTWLRENRTREGVVTTTDSWLLARLGAGYVTDAATASRTLLLDLERAEWSADACATFGADPAELPAVVDCAAIAGETTAFGPGRALPIAGLAVDQQAALLAEHCLTAGEAKCTYGTGAFLLAVTGTRAVRSRGGLAASIAWRLSGQSTYCLDGQVYTAGAAIRWLRSLGLIESPADLDQGAAADAGGVTFVPSLAGLGAPHWRPDARGAFTGLGLAATRAHLIRAVIDGIAASVALLSRAMTADLGPPDGSDTRDRPATRDRPDTPGAQGEPGAPLRTLRADGGLTRSRLLMQAQADLLQVPVEICRTPDATALGVAALARLGAGDVADLASAVRPPQVEAVIEPSITADQAAERNAAFAAALSATLDL
jgi:glycerol kinase